MTVNVEIGLMVVLCYLTVLQFMDANLYGVLGIGALSLWAVSLVANDTFKTKRRD